MSHPPDADKADTEHQADPLHWADKPVRDVAAAIVQDAATGRVLLLQRGPTAPLYPDHWGPVTGMVEPDETPQQATQREIEEELGLTGHVLHAGPPFLVDVGAFIVRVHPFLCALDDPAGEIVLQGENQAYRWLTTEDALAERTIPDLDKDFRALGLL